VVKELIQEELTSENITIELKRLLTDDKYRETMLAEYAYLIEQLGGAGASKRIATHIVSDVKEATVHA